ncbi:MAG: hydratase [Eubacteriales bacterium]|jgi:aconitate hydratase|nr:hydratase [Clostridiales bacterium]
MIKLHDGGVFIRGGREIAARCDISPDEARRATITYKILSEHDTPGGDGKKLRLKFDALASHDITYVGIIQSARVRELEKFPMPYVLTNCHNSLCAVGGTINEDDHMFGLSAVKKYGGIFVPPHQAVIHSYMREQFAACGRMILGSDSHTRYGALGTLAIGEGGPELVKQLVGETYDIDMPQVVAVMLRGSPRPGVGPHDVALAIIGAVFDKRYVTNKVMEFIGDGIANLPIEYRNGIDVMTTETTCLSSIWMTDAETERYFRIHGRPQDYAPLAPGEIAYYDGLIEVDLSAIEPMIALPCHPSKAYKLSDVIANPYDILKNSDIDLTSKITPDGKIRVDQGIIAGCAGGTFDNICAAADIIGDSGVGSDAFSMSVYPGSQPVMSAILKNGVASTLIGAGVTLRTAFCGPCFGAGDVPAHGSLSIRHTTRNFPHREGSKSSEGQIAAVALMDARSIAATAKNGGILTSALSLDVDYKDYDYTFDDKSYRARVYNGWGNPKPETELVYGPNITDWPDFEPLEEHLLLAVCSVIDDPVTTTDELIPSGETSSYRSNPIRLADFTLSRKDPGYVERAKAAVRNAPPAEVLATAKELTGSDKPQIASTIYAVKPGDGSAREQAASCQRVLGGAANIAREYATKRYRSNLINWGMLPFILDIDVHSLPFGVGDYILVRNVRDAVEGGATEFDAFVIKPDGAYSPLTLTVDPLTDEERQILLAGCLMNTRRK